MKSFSDIVTNSMLAILLLGVLVLPISSMGIMQLEDSKGVLSVQDIKPMIKATLDFSGETLESTQSTNPLQPVD